jgi:hypothetical protein
VGTEIEEQKQHLIMSLQYIFLSPYSRNFGTVFEEGQSVVHRPYRMDFYNLYSHFVAQKSRQVVVWVFWKVWHGFQGGRIAINTPRNFL